MFNVEKIIYNISDISEISKKLLLECTSKTICLSGQLGSGKTTLTKAFLKGIEANESGHSPTFSIVNEIYNIQSNLVAYHIDCYRLESEEEALDIGIEEYLASDIWVFIEWPERIQSLLPDVRTEIELEVIDEHTRKLSLQNLP